MGKRHHEAEVDAVGRERVEDRVVGRVDEDLSDVAAVRHADDVGDEGHPGEPMRMATAERVRDRRGAAVGGHHDARAHLHPGARAVHADDPHHVAVLDHDVGDPHPEVQVHRLRAHAVEQGPVERGAGDADRLLSIWAEAADGAVTAGEHGAVGGGDAHAGQRDGAPRVEHLQRTESVEDAAGLGAQVLAADFGPRARAALEHGHGQPLLSEQDGRGRAGGPGADDQDVGGAHHVASTTSRASHG